MLCCDMDSLMLSAELREGDQGPDFHFAMWILPHSNRRIRMAIHGVGIAKPDFPHCTSYVFFIRVSSNLTGCHPLNVETS